MARETDAETRVGITVGGKPVADTWETHEDIAHGAVLTDIFCREEVSNPHTPHGINVVSRSLEIRIRLVVKPLQTLCNSIASLDERSRTDGAIRERFSIRKTLSYSLA